MEDGQYLHFKGAQYNKNKNAKEETTTKPLKTGQNIEKIESKTPHRKNKTEETAQEKGTADEQNTNPVRAPAQPDAPLSEGSTF